MASGRSVRRAKRSPVDDCLLFQSRLSPDSDLPYPLKLHSARDTLELEFLRLTIDLFFLLLLRVFVLIWIQSRVILLTLATLGVAVGFHG